MAFRNPQTGQFANYSQWANRNSQSSGGNGLVVPITADARNFHSGLASANTALKSFAAGTTSSLSRIGGTFRRMTSMVNPLTAAIGIGGLAGGFIALTAANERLTQAMTRSLAIFSNVSDVLVGEMRTAAIETARTTMFSAAEAAQAYFYLGSAGYDAAQSLKLLPVTTTFAQAGMFDLSTATTLLADSQSALGMKMEDPIENMKSMTRVADVLTQANILANAEVEDFAVALTNKAAAAMRLVNKDIEEGVAVLAAYADQGIKGAEAGTALGIVMRDMQTKALKHPAAFKAAGVEIFNAAGKMNNMADIIEDLENRLEGLSDAQKKQALLAMGFADRSVAFTQVLLGTSDRIREYESGLRNAGGAAAELAAKSLTPLQKALNEGKAAMQEMGEAMTPVIGFIAEQITGWSKLVKAYRDLPPAVRGQLAWGDMAEASLDEMDRQGTDPQYRDKLRDFGMGENGKGRSAAEIKDFILNNPDVDDLLKTDSGGYMERLRQDLSPHDYGVFQMRMAMQGRTAGITEAMSRLGKENESEPRELSIYERAGQGIRSGMGGFRNILQRGANYASRPAEYVRAEKERIKAEMAEQRKARKAAGFDGVDNFMDAWKGKGSLVDYMQQNRIFESDSIFGKLENKAGNALAAARSQGLGGAASGMMKDFLGSVGKGVAYGMSPALISDLINRDGGPDAKKKRALVKSHAMHVSAQDPLSREGNAQRVRTLAAHKPDAVPKLQLAEAKKQTKELSKMSQALQNPLIMAAANIA